MPVDERVDDSEGSLQLVLQIRERHARALVVQGAGDVQQHGMLLDLALYVHG